MSWPCILCGEPKAREGDWPCEDCLAEALEPEEETDGQAQSRVSVDSLPSTEEW